MREINLKVRKTIRYQLKISKRFIITDDLFLYSIFSAFTKRTTIRDNKQKFRWNLLENAVEAVKSFSPPQKMFDYAFFECQKFVSELSSNGLGKKLTKKRKMVI